MHCDSFVLRSLGFHRVSPSHPAFRVLSMCQKPVISRCEPCPLSRDCNTCWPTKVCQDLPNEEVMELHVCMPHLPQTVPILWDSAHPLNERDTHFSIRLPWEDTTHCSDSRRLTPKELVSPSIPSWFSAATKGAQESGMGDVSIVYLGALSTAALQGGGSALAGKVLQKEHCSLVPGGRGTQLA